MEGSRVASVLVCDLVGSTERLVALGEDAGNRDQVVKRAGERTRTAKGQCPTGTYTRRVFQFRHARVATNRQR